MQILFTSAGSPSALALARVLAASGHTVHGADTEHVWGTSPARYSRAYRRFHRLTATQGAVELWKTLGEHIDLVIPFGPLPSKTIETLRSQGANVVGETLAHNDHDFQDFVRDNVINAAPSSPHAPSIVKVPTSFVVHSRTCIAEILSNRDSTFVLQPLPCYDTDDEDTLVEVGHSASASASEPATPLVVSCSTLDDTTVEAIKKLPISDTRPYRLIEVATGGAFYSAHAFVHAGQLRTFTVVNTRAADRDFVLVEPGSALYDVLFQFTAQFADALVEWQTVVANHLSLTFHVQEKVKYGSLVKKITVVSCRNEPHGSLALLACIPQIRKDLARAYTAPSLSDEEWTPVQVPGDVKVSKAMFSATMATAGLARILLKPAFWRREWWTRLVHMVMMCLVWVVNFREEMWDSRDPGPALCFWVGSFLSYTLNAGSRVKLLSGMRRSSAGVSNRWLLAQVTSRMVLLVVISVRYCVGVLLTPWVFSVRGALRVTARARLILQESGKMSL